ncbi:hypothetical protein [Rhodobaculum claviforme]|uniref:Uncharacterized protein n=1 Tax=Rhodobaculum claviforme TaxID=1549854 RepID=A0A934WIG1_9RHOB|nr:hypothetical protein [Rhodobaculum claviforme]MBK5926518.1 hypothetical protein [Rhodobaculum claviforme]
MAALVWGGAAVTLAGLAGIVWCIISAVRARRAGLDDAALRARMHRVVVVNFAALLVSALGLAIVVAGLFLA